jgi:hypothetical protein
VKDCREGISGDDYKMRREVKLPALPHGHPGEGE